MVHAFYRRYERRPFRGDVGALNLTTGRNSEGEFERLEWKRLINRLCIESVRGWVQQRLPVSTRDRPRASEPGFIHRPFLLSKQIQRLPVAPA